MFRPESSDQKFFRKEKLLQSRASDPNTLLRFIERFRENYVSTELVRVGGEGDGGYLLPDILSNVSHCFSPGVSFTADFEAELSRNFGIRCLLADASVEAAPLSDPNFSFVQKFVGSRTEGQLTTLSDWMSASLDGSERDLLLQMDIEGSEFDVLTLESNDVLERFGVIIVEFHGMERLFDEHFLSSVSAIFEKLYQKFSVCHVHPNNIGGIASLGEIEVPRLFEVSFVRDDLLRSLEPGREIVLPHPLDAPNVPDMPDISMPAMWWKTE